MGNVEITQREIALSAIIILMMIALGLFISNVISDAVRESNEVYFTSQKIDNDQEAFSYAMRTNAGKTMVYGELSAVQPVKFEELLQGYFYVEKVTQRYTKHTRTVKDKDTNGKEVEREETYYSWDYWGSRSGCTNEFSFLGSTFSVRKISFPPSSRVHLDETTLSGQYLGSVSWDYLYEGSTWWNYEGQIRYHYNCIPRLFLATLFVDAKENSFTGVNSGTAEMFYLRTIQEAIGEIEGRETTYLVLFWVFYSLSIAAIVFVVITLENRWLEDRNKSEGNYRR